MLENACIDTKVAVGRILAVIGAHKAYPNTRKYLSSETPSSNRALCRSFRFPFRGRSVQQVAIQTVAEKSQYGKTKETTVEKLELSLSP